MPTSPAEPSVAPGPAEPAVIPELPPTGRYCSGCHAEIRTSQIATRVTAEHVFAVFCCENCGQVVDVAEK